MNMHPTVRGKLENSVLEEWSNQLVCSIPLKSRLLRANRILCHNLVRFDGII